VILTRTRLHPFSGISDRTLSFTSGLNVVLGPNEAGKSTVFYAIQTVLFTPSGITKKVFEIRMRKFLPVGGGDTVRVTVDLVDNGNTYTLERSWGGKNEAELRLPDGMILTDDETIQSSLAPLLHANEGTYRSVLMTYQTGLQKTVDELKSDYMQTVHTLGDILRKSVLLTDGVSLDRFKEDLFKRYGDYYDHWDEKLAQPERGRGVNNPWQTKIGHILKAFYEKEGLRASYEKAVEYERKIDGMNRLISEKEEEAVQKKRFLKENKPLYEAAKEQKLMRGIEARMNQLREANRRWPVAEDCIRKAEASISGLTEKKKGLEKEREESGIEASNRTLRERYRSVKERKEALDKEKRNLVDIKKIDRDALDTLQKLLNEKENIQGRITAGRLRVTVKAKRDLSLLVQKDLSGGEKRKIDTKHPVTFEAGGRIKLESPDMDMEIMSGEASDRNLIEGLEDTEGKINDLFRRYEIESFEDAVRINGIYEAQQQKIRHEEALLENALNGQSFEKLKADIEMLQEGRQTREQDIIIGELLEVGNEIAKEELKRQGYEQEITRYESSYGSQEKLLLEVATAVKEHESLVSKLKGLPALPGEMEDPERFVGKYEEYEIELGTVNDEVNRLRLERAGIEKDEPEMSSEEYATELGAAEERYRHTMEKAEAFARIKRLSERLVSELDSATYEGIGKKLEGYVAAVTDGKYKKVDMHESLPDGFVRKDGTLLPHALLSAGTRDTLALALRLSMAEYFLEESDGFLLMDDPLVNLDPQRQEKAAGVLLQFAEKRQIILFSCHPSHADLLGGTLVRL
jgi:exonuclease SbcC